MKSFHLRGGNWILGAFLWIGLPAWAQSSSRGPAAIVVIFPERQKERKSSRWTLADWMETRRTIDSQNRWLFEHSNKNPLDLTLGLDQDRFQTGAEVDLYLARIGFRFRNEQPSHLFERFGSGDLALRKNESSLQLRLMGGNLQDTNLILRASYSQAQLLGPAAYQDHYALWSFGPELQIYFAQWLGVRGAYTYTLPAKGRDHRNFTLKQTRYWAGGFLEFGALRTEFGYRSTDWTLSGAQDLSKVQGNWFGCLRLFY